MKSILLLSTVCTLLALSFLPSAWGQPGGWAKASVKEQAVIDAANFAVKAQQEELKKAGKEDKLTLDKIVTAEQQVVQGMNYKLTLQVKFGEKVQTAEAKVWARVWLKPDEQYKLTAWKLADEKDSGKGEVPEPKK